MLSVKFKITQKWIVKTISSGDYALVNIAFHSKSDKKCLITLTETLSLKT